MFYVQILRQIRNNVSCKPMTIDCVMAVKAM